MATTVGSTARPTTCANSRCDGRADWRRIGDLWSIGFPADIDGPQNALIGLYNTLGLTDQAEALAHDGLDPVLSKAILGIVGLAVGIGGIWFIYIGVHSILEMLAGGGTAASFSGCCGPALLIVGVFLVFPPSPRSSPA